MRGSTFTVSALVFAAVVRPDKRVKRWSAALHVTLAAMMVAAGLAITAVAHAAGAAARLSVTSTWQTGFIARFTIVNASAVPMTDWRLEFDLPPGESVSHTWSSTLTRYGTHYVLGPANWNRIIQPGGSATGGLRGVLSGVYSPPSNCVLNGQYPCS
ncbi:cellulose-binding domain-containing protein [Mycolicibacterium farcinogenes]|uniref:Cellulose-binding domain-containing protein n=1 Tax=Mycolicibacterium farcinogenes TaxID=1802 RepID=A0ACD1F9C6_MYCFR|nr:cellulose-binding domain-containing protein [Mycolicibacterium farcinogenes]QZH63646.1 cellulose-binding domain-containing protein [Mycolicibacterium farcinogenes]